MLIAFVSCYLLVLARAFQQKNVMHDLYVPAMLTSFAIAAGDVGVIMAGVQLGWAAVPYLGAGGALGVITAMFIHNKLFKRKVVR